MSQPVKLSDALVLDARIAAEAQERSIAGQVEFWAKLGRSVELLLDGQQVLALCRTVGATPLADLVDSVDTPKGRERFKTYLESEPYPHFEAHPTEDGLLVRIDQDGKRIAGRFRNRIFVAQRLAESEPLTGQEASDGQERLTALKGAGSTARTTGNADASAALRVRGLKRR
jgi:hypothetical protein